MTLETLDRWRVEVPGKSDAYKLIDAKTINIHRNVLTFKGPNYKTIGTKPLSF